MDIIRLGWNETRMEQFLQYQGNELIPARVSREDKHRYHVLSSEGETTAVISGKLRHSIQVKSDFPAIGDWVAFRPSSPDSDGVIHTLLPRTSCFSRKVAGSRTDEQILAANIDTVFLVSGLDGDFNVRRLERYLTAAWSSDSQVLIVLNKLDVCSDLERQIAKVSPVAQGVPIVAISAVLNIGFEALSPYLDVGKTVALLGSSGVGKSTIINALIGIEIRDTGGIRLDDSKGRHTTTSRELVQLPGGAVVIDTPGMREFQPWGDSETLEGSFADIEELAGKCRFSDCRHESEPGCAIRAALENGELDKDRLNAYRKICRELARLERRRFDAAAIADREKWKKIAMLQRRMPRKGFR